MSYNAIVLPKQTKVSFDRTASAAAPVAPTLSSVTPGNGENTIVWTSVSGAIEYRVYFDTTSPVTSADAYLSVGTATSIVHTGLTNGTTYYYRIAAVGVADVSALSNELSGKPNVALYSNTLSTQFDGVNDYVDFGNNHNYDNAVQWSLSAWVRPNNLSARHCIWAKTSNDTNVFGWSFHQDTSGKCFIQVRASGQLRTYTTTSTPFSALTWTHFCMTYDGSQNVDGIKLYFDGTFDSSPASGVVTNTLIHTDPSRVGIRYTANPFSGHIDEVSFWSVELSSSEVSEVYNSGTPDNLLDHSQSANIDSWYRLGDGDTSPTVSDNVGVVDGTLTNGAAFDSEVP